MTTHPWLAPSAALVGKVTRARAKAVLRSLAAMPAKRLGTFEAAWTALLRALPGLVRAAPGPLFDAVGRVDVLPVLQELTSGAIEPNRLERALVTWWLALSGQPGLATPLVLTGPFRARVVDPHNPRLLVLGRVRGLVAAASGPVVIGLEGRRLIDEFVISTLPSVNGTVLTNEEFGPPEADVVDRARAALTLVATALPGCRVERLTVGPGAAELGEARVDRRVDPADIVASAEAAFIRAAAMVEPILVRERGLFVHQQQRLTAVDVLARACGNAVALPWHADRAATANAIVDDLDEVVVLAEPTAAGVSLIAGVRALCGAAAGSRRRGLLVNPDADDFVYSVQFGRSVERRCAERELHLDRIGIRSGRHLDLAAELGGPVPAPIADGIELLVESEHDPTLAALIARLAGRRYEVLVANVRPSLFYDLFDKGFFAARVLLWDRHLHGGLREEGQRRGFDASRLRESRSRAWSLADRAGQGIHEQLVDAGLQQGSGRPWPLDLEFFRSNTIARPGSLFAGGDNGRDWPLLMEAVRGLPIDVHLVSSQAPAELPPNVRADRRLTLSRFRDAVASASIMALPLLPGIAAGVTVLPMAMALGVAVVATQTPWTEQYVADGQEALLVPAQDVAAFRDAIVRLCAEPDLRERLAANARKRVAALCDIEAFTGEMFATLD